jgi:glycosyltransferase involved in cell wall biosynthesis
VDFKEFKDKYQKVPVELFPNKVLEDPIVSVCVQTYQHATYIKDCLDGILSQETDFPFEILLGEDESKDETRNICIEYAKKYPERIKLFLHNRENNIKIGGNPTGRFNFIYNLCSANGKYIALCEGDDYWTDPLKLQKQVDLVEGNKILIGSFHACDKIFQDSIRAKIERFKGYRIIDLSFYLKNRVFITTGSLLFRKEILKNYKDWAYELFAADFLIKYLILLEGKIGYIDDVMSVYRKGTPGSWTNLNLTQQRIDREYKDNVAALIHINDLSNFEYKNEVFIKLNKLYIDYLNRSIEVMPFKNGLLTVLINIVKLNYRLLSFFK